MLTLHPVTVLQLVFLVQAIFGIVLLMKQPRFRGLVYLLSLIAGLLTFNILEENQITRDIHLVTPVFSLLSGPFFYGFVYLFLIQDAKLHRRHLLHIIPALVALPLTSWPQWVLFFGTVSQVIYLVACIRLVTRYHQITDNLTAQSYHYRLNWLRRLIMVIILIDVVDLIRLNLQPYLSLDVAQAWYFFMQLAFFLFYSSLIVYSVRRPDLFEEVAEKDLNLESSSNQLSANELQQALELFTALDAQIKDKQLYLQPRLTLRIVSEQVGINEKEISWAINHGGKISFNDYINRLRIDELIARFKNRRPRQTILELALECGFNSKSSFNAVFKQQQGMTPSQYLKSDNPI